MNFETFHERLRATGAYRSFEDTPRPRMRRAGPAANLRYFAGMLRIVFSGMIRASRGKFDRRTWAEHGFRFLRLVERFGTEARIEGFASVRDSAGPVVCVANHMGSLETMILPSILLAYRDTAVVARASLTDYPVFGASLRATDPIVVSRDNPRADLKTVLTRGGEMLRAGRSVVLFPQATRSETFDPARFNSLGVKLATRSGTPLVPVAVATDFVAIGRWIRDAGPVNPERPVRFRAGPRLDPDLGASEIQRQAIAFIVACLEEWGYPVIHSKKEAP